MPVTFADLYDLETAVETAVLAVLSTATGLTGYRTQSAATKTAPRFEIEYDQGQTMNHKYPFGGNSYDDIYKGSLTVRIITIRQKAGQTADHRALRGKIQAALVPGIGNFTTANLPFHQLADLRLKSCPFTCDDNEDKDITELRYDAVCGIRAEAWELTVTPSFDSSLDTFDSSVLTFDTD